jgi:uncharacterized membrane protein
MAFKKEKPELMKDKAAMLSGKFMEIVPYVAYFPFIGWFFPMYFKKDDRFLLFHSVQGFVLAAFFFVLSSMLFFLTAFLPSGGGLFKFIAVMLIYAGYLIYFVIAAAGTYFLVKGIEKEIPFFERIAKRIEIL